MRDWYDAFKAMMLFRTYSYFPRWYEIGCGIMGWINVGIIIWGITKAL